MKKGKYKNKLWYGSKLSQYKTEKILRCFADNLSVVETASITKVSATTIKKHFYQFRKTMFYAAFGYGNLFNGAGILLSIGPPRNSKDANALAAKREHGKVRESNWFLWEVLIRAYAGYSYSSAELSVIKFYAGFRLAVYNRILIKEIADSPILEDLDLVPKNPIKSVSVSEIDNIPELSQKTDIGILEFWNAIIMKEFEIPDYIWDYVFSKKRNTGISNDIIYQDLRWYLLKHPINSGENQSLSPKRSGHILPAQDDYNEELKKLIRFAQERKHEQSSEEVC